MTPSSQPSNLGQTSKTCWISLLLPTGFKKTFLPSPPPVAGGGTAHLNSSCVEASTAALGKTGKCRTSRTSGRSQSGTDRKWTDSPLTPLDRVRCRFLATFTSIWRKMRPVSTLAR